MLVLPVAVAAGADPLSDAQQALADALEQHTDDNAPVDTTQTPRPKPDIRWQQIGGALFPGVQGSDGTKLVAGSATTAADDLFTVSFRANHPEQGFAAGATRVECAGSPRRVPVIYRYVQAETGDASWQRAYVGGCDGPGFVGAIAWVSGSRVLAVGGDGEYPRRERAWDGRDVTDPQKTDQAGKGRAWLFDPTAYADEDWHEQDLSALRPDEPTRAGMRGMTALDCDPKPGSELCWAGALGQLWQWRSGQFVTAGRLDKQAPAGELENRRLFDFRVRDITFVPGDPMQILAVTAGCCAENPLNNTARTLAYSTYTDTSPLHSTPRWHAAAGPAQESINGWAPGLADPDEQRCGSVCLPGQLNGNDVAYEPGRLSQRPLSPESAYAVTGQRFTAQTLNIVVLLSSGGPGPMPGQRGASRLECRSSDPFGSEPPAVSFDEPISSARLVAADGDSAARPVSGMFKLPADAGPWQPFDGGLNSRCRVSLQDRPDQPDGVPDWLVGELASSTRPDGGARGVVVATFLPARRGSTISVLPAPEVTDADKALNPFVSDYYATSSFSLNAIDVIGDGVAGWAVGDRGALLQLGQGGGGTTSVVEDRPPRLGAPALGALPSRDAYDAYRPAGGGGPGSVPALAARPERRLPERRLSMAGAPDVALGSEVEDVREIVMSRDGREGWAIGPSEVDPLKAGFVTSMFHFSGGAWSRCDPVGISGVLAADRACASIRQLREYTENNQPRPVRLIAMARIPLENDADPSNDDDFEAVAIGTRFAVSPGGRKLPALLAYRDGRWSLLDEAARAKLDLPEDFTAPELTDIAFTAPDDGWILGASSTPTLFHYDGASWSRCGAGNGWCGDTRQLARFIGPGISTTRYDVVDGLTAAGDRVYLYGSRVFGASSLGGSRYPMILFRERGGPWRNDRDSGGYDPSCESPQTEGCGPGSPEEQGEVHGLALAAVEGGAQGWAMGRFGGNSVTSNVTGTTLKSNDAQLLRLGPGGRWEPYRPLGPLGDSFDPSSVVGRQRMAIDPGSGDSLLGIKGRGAIFGWSDGDGWRLVPARRPRATYSTGDPEGVAQAISPDGRGGFWVALKDSDLVGRVQFAHYTDRQRTPVLSEVAGPLTGAVAPVTAMASGEDGSVWLATASNTLFRYDRMTGWDSARIPGWDAGRLVTRPSAVTAVAGSPSGSAVAVGEQGRIATISRTGARLDQAAGTVCDLAAIRPPCGTSRDLLAASVAPDGAALVAGRRLSLLWRPAGGSFRAIERPLAGQATAITGVSFPRADRAWLATSAGQVFAGEMDVDGHWRWRREGLTAAGDPLTLTADGVSTGALRAIAVDDDGHGYAVGDGGVILARDADDGPHPWVRLESRTDHDLVSLALLPDGGALVGGTSGLVLTAESRQVNVVRESDYVREGTSGPVIGVAAAPGSGGPGAEAWAVIAGPGPDAGASRLLHYDGDSADPLTDPSGRVQPLPDTPAPRPGELAFAAFGKTECRIPRSDFACPPPGGTTADHEVITQRIVDELIGAVQRPGGPRFGLFTGDMTDSSGTAGTAAASDLASTGIPAMRRWLEMVYRPLQSAGVPLFGAIGSQDLSDISVCDPECHFTTKEIAKTGENVGWRRETASAWGREQASEGGGLRFVPVDDGPLAVRQPDVSTPNVAEVADGRHVLPGGARTHYAVDVLREDRPLARLVFVDSSIRSLAAADAAQNPVEPHGGQLEWLERMICTPPETTTAREDCTRAPGQQAIVISTTPTYSYGAGTGTDTELDGTVLETVLMRHRASLVVSGRLGWNSVYWAIAPGVHEPCPGGAYQSTPPQPNSRICGNGEQGGQGDPLSAADRVSGALRSLGAPPPPTALTDPIKGQLLPFVVASGGGGKFADQAPEEGAWHGYTIIRLDASGDPGATIVEQRPVLDWIALSAASHTIYPGQRMRLRGVGREPIGDAYSNSEEGHAIPLTSPAVTHRYDLVEADPERPYLPRVVDGNGQPHGYVAVDQSVARIDPLSGQVTAQRSNHGRVYAIAILSVADKAAGWPMVFESRRSYTPPPAPRVAVGSVPTTRVLSFVPTSLQPPASPPPADTPPPIATKLVLPAPPALPGLPTAAGPPIAPPVPPAPPAPPAGQQAAPLDLTIGLTGISVPPTTGVTAQPTPPVNPSPPGGARKEARQRQAATAKSEEGASDKASDAAGDLAGAPPSNANRMTRRDPARAEAGSLTAIQRPHQASAWAVELEWLGGISAMALILALGFTTLRPTPRLRLRRSAVPQPASAWVRERYRR